MANQQPLTIKKLITPSTSAVQSAADNTLGHVLSQVRSSHDAVFIYDEQENFVGLISPYETVYSRNFPYTTKVSSVATVPPTITADTPVHLAAEFMLATKMYVLPVFADDGSVAGVIHVKDLLQEIVKDSELLQFVSDQVQASDPITAPLTSLVKDVFYDLKEKGVSRLILTGEQGELRGIVTRGDLMDT